MRALLLSSLALAAQASLVVNTTSGQVKGRLDVLTGTEYFYGIPFGKAERFAPAGDPEAWDGVKELGELQPPMCPQGHLIEDMWFGQEDCLTVDIWRPGGLNGGENLPVMVWIYGGGYVIGSEDQINIYNGKKLAKNFNTIVVAMNYRVNNLGFLALPSLFAEHNTTGNYGLLDQQYAMKWVQKNIRNFGGDPSRVEIYGQSAGGCSVVAQLSMPSSFGLFSSAAIESSLPVSNVMWVDLKDAYAFGEMYAGQVGCPAGPDQLSCLRTKPLKDILNPLLEWRHSTPKNASFLPALMPILTWWPTIDGTTLPDTPYNMAKSGRFHDVPTIIGTVENEGTIFTPGLPFVVNSSLDVPIVYPLEQDGWVKTIEHFFGKTQTSQKVVSFYEQTHPTRENMTLYYTDLAADFLRDFFFACPARYLQRAITTSPTRKSPLYVYHFNQTISSYLYDIFGDYHTAEIPYVHDLVDEWRKWTPEEVALGAKMAGFWTSLAAKQSPITCPTCPEWVPFVGGSKEGFMAFETPTAMQQNLYQNICDFWDTIGYETVV